MRIRLLLLIGAAASSAALLIVSPPLPEARADAREDAGLAAFEVVRAVFQHPRCANCHIPGDAPLQTDDSRVHGQNVRRGPLGEGVPGLACRSCHGEANLPDSYGPHTPPGAPGWKLPKPETKMVFHGLSASALARSLKDPQFTGGRDLKALQEHLEHDPLVLWGWAPGRGRAPVPVPHAEFVARFKAWVEAGAPVPPEK